jgi:CubicO group peptidase (beta-lactamase class C family)
MTPTLRSRFALGMLAALVLAGFAFVAGGDLIAAQQAGKKAAEIVEGKPEAAGFSSERLGRLHAVIQGLVDQKQLPGVVTLLARHGKVVEERTYGEKDIASKAPMTKDTIFRIYSMSKPVTGVAMMMLYEEGKWRLEDPISKYIPEFAPLKVFKGNGADGNMILEDPAHPPTMQELMTHTAGFTYGIFGDTSVDKMYNDAKLLRTDSLRDFIDKLVKIPLLYQPGSRWVYSVSMDIQGYIIEKLSGQSLPDFEQQRIFGPLGMKDTGFFVPAEKRNRFATLYAGNDAGELELYPKDAKPLSDFATQPTAPSGGGGMVSTAEDYLRFSQMLLNGGELDGVRILAPATVQLMTANHLSPSLMVGAFDGDDVTRPGAGWGYDCATYSDPLLANEVVGKGTFFWGGAADTWFWVDPTNDLIFVGMTQRFLDKNRPNMHRLTYPVVYQALVNPRM